MTPKSGGNPTRSWAEANEVVIKIRASKTDQYNRGEWRNHFRVAEAAVGTGDARLCVVEALEIYEGWARERFSGARMYDPLFAFDDAKLVTRADVQRIVMQSAVAEGVDPDDLGSHSLRIGGASALYAAFKDTALVQRWGRWNSDAFQGYLWEARDMAEGVASSMAAADLTMV